VIHFICIFYIVLSNCQSLLVSFHGGSDCTYCNVVVFSLQGNQKGNLFSSNNQLELRGLASMGQNIYIAGGAGSTSIYFEKGCGNSIQQFAGPSSSLQHPYGVAISQATQTIYVSNQNGNDAAYF